MQSTDYRMIEFLDQTSLSLQSSQDKEMAETAIETNRQDDLMMKRENGETVEINRDLDSCSETKTNFLAELNLILILSFLSLSGEECPDLEETDGKENLKDLEEKHTVSRLRTGRREMNESKIVESRTPRFQTKIKDCRHCRRM
ncbi:hypothetical protein U1Q18_023631 [Sarracenia purpurea var. burkii]